MLNRLYVDQLQGLLRRWPAVVVLGSRQSGKTTLVRQALPAWTYLDLERPSDAAPLVADPEARLAQLGDRVIFDEAQLAPALFSILRSVIDAHRNRRGRFVLLGSASPTLVKGIAESLAGRAAFLHLPPFQWDEVHAGRPGAAIGDLWFRGGFPRAFLTARDIARHEWLENYTRAVVERDLPALGVDVSASLMRRLWTMVAHMHGGLWNASQMAQSLGVSYHTVNRYLDVLEQTFLVRRLPPYFVNIRKRLVKSPKVYVRDTGLLHYLLGIGSAKALDTHPARGSSWEGFIVEHVIAAIERHQSSSRVYFWRTAVGQEVDLVIDHGTRRVPIEIKLQSSPTSEDAKGVVTCMADLRMARGYLVHSGHQTYSLGRGVTAIAATDLLADPKRIAKL